jgi:hypothetical protein
MRIVVYDLTSENHRALRDTGYVDKLRAIRVKATVMLHRLGVQSTESVILVDNGRENEVLDVIHAVHDMYAQVLREIRDNCSVSLPQPLIRILEITQPQFEIFRDLAKRRIREQIDAQIDRVSSIIETANSQTENRNVKAIVNSLRKVKREWLRIRSCCVNLGISLESDIDYLIDLIDQAVAQLNGVGP